MDFFDLLVGLETELWNRVERALLDGGHVGLGTLMALRALHRRGGAGRVGQLRSDLIVTVGAASKLVDRLERDGLAVRRPHPQDGRSSLISLTDAGERARSAGERVARTVLADLLGDGPDVAAATTALGRLSERLSITAEEVSA